MLRVDAKGLKSIITAIGLLCLVLLLMPNSAFAAEMNDDVTMDGTWTPTQTACGGGSCTGAVSGGIAQITSNPFEKNNQVAYQFVHNISSVGAGAQVTAASLQGAISDTLTSTKAVNFIVEINDGGSWYTVFTYTSDPGTTLTNLTPNAASLPYTTIGSTTQIRLTLDVTSNSNGNVLTYMRADNLSITYTPAASPPTTTVTDGTDPGDSTPCPGDSGVSVDAFDLNETSGNQSSTVSSVTLSLTGNTNVSTVYVTCGGSSGSVASPGATPTVTLTPSVTVPASNTVNCSVTVDLTGGASGSVNASVTDIAVTGNKGSITDTGTSQTIGDQDLATVTITQPADPSTISGATYEVRATIGVESAPGTGSATVTTSGTTGGTCDVGPVAMTWDAVNTWFDYSWNISLCGNPLDDANSVQVIYTDPDCSDTASDTNNNITINNVAAQDNLNINGFTDQAPGTIDESSTNNLMLRVRVNNDYNDDGALNLTSVKIDRLGTCADSDVAEVKLYHSTDATCTTGDTLLGSGATFSTGSVTYSGLTQAIAATPTDEYLCVFISMAASGAGQTVGVRIASAASFTTSEGVNAWAGPADSGTPTIQTPAACTDTITACAQCHGEPPSDGARNWQNGTVVGDHQKHGTTCTVCHVNVGAGEFNHRNGLINMVSAIDGEGFYDKDMDTVNNDPITFAQSSSPTTGSCSSLFCHGTGSPQWGVGTITCNSCHPIQPSTGSHTKHLSSGAACGNCHDGAVEGVSNSGSDHSDKNIDVYDVSSGDLGYTPNKTPNTVYDTCDNASCHDNGTGAKVATPTWGQPGGCGICHASEPGTGSHTKHLDSGAVCGNCHDGAIKDSTHTGAQHTDNNVDVYDVASGDLGYTPNKTKNTPYDTCDNASCHDDGTGAKATTPTWGQPGGCGICHASEPGTGSHTKHLDSGAVCGNCHDGAIKDSTHTGAQHTDNNVDVYDVASGDLGYTPNKTKNTPYDICDNASCHDDGTGAKATTPTWGQPGGCGACHASEPGTGSHTNHLNYSASIGCGNCHDGAIKDSTHTGAQHLDNNVDVYDVSSGDLGYTPNKTKNTSYETCENIMCHGSLSRTWGNNTTRDACTKCHGDTAAGSSATDAQIAPPNDTNGNTAATDTEVGAHQIHLKSSTSTAPIVSYNITCNTCHTKPASVFASGHIDTALPAELTFGSLATNNGATPTWNPSTHVCSNNYCHNETYFTKNNHTDSGSWAPAWNDTTYQSGSSPRTATDCGRCHFYNTVGNDCQSCHKHVNSTNNGFDSDGGGLADHMNGTVEGGGGCLGCHGGVADGGDDGVTRRQIVGGTAGSAGDDFVRASRHVSDGTTTNEIVTDQDCIVCHMEGDQTAGDGSFNSTYHPSATDNIDLRDVDSTNGGSLAVAWPGSGSASDTDRTNMDNFCMGCHDANGSSQIAVNNNNPPTGMLLGTSTVTGTNRLDCSGSSTGKTSNLRPFNCADTLLNANDKNKDFDGDTNTIGNFRTTTYGRVLDVKAQFSTSNASHHAVLGQKYTTTSSWPVAAWTSYTNLKGQVMSTIRERAQLHCADCHLNEVNAHGSRNSWYMTCGSSTSSCTDIAPNQSTMSGEIMCYRCHAVGSYDDDTMTATNSRHEHSGCPRGVGTRFWNAIGCSACHGAWGDTAQEAWGGLGQIHGTNQTYYPAGGGTSSLRYRFMNGAGNRLYTPNASGYSGTADWQGTANTDCYVTYVDNWADCSNHAGGKGKATNWSRNLSY